MKIPIDPTAPLLAQLRPWGLDLRGAVMNRGVLVYRFYDDLDALLYIGVTCSPPVRFQSHKNYADWWAEVSFLMIERHPYEAAARAAEVEAINTEDPKHNTQRKRSPIPGASRERVGSETQLRRERVGPYARAGARATRRVRDRRQETGVVGHPCIVSTGRRAARNRPPAPFPAMHGLAPLAGGKP